MYKPKVEKGQEWEKWDEHDKIRTRVRVMSEPYAGRVAVSTVGKGGRLVRYRTILLQAFSNTPSGYVLKQRAPTP